MAGGAFWAAKPRKMEKTMSISTVDRHDEHTGKVHHLLARLATTLQRLGDRYRAATGLHQLESMSDWQLRDIGFDRCGIRHGISLKANSHHAE